MPRTGLLFLRDMRRPIAAMSLVLAGMLAFSVVAEALREKPCADIAVDEQGAAGSGSSGLRPTIRVLVIED